MPVLPLPEAGALLRPFAPADAPSLALHANDHGIWLNLRDRFPHPYSVADAEAYIAMVNSEEGQRDLHLCIDVAGEAVGSISLLFKHDVNRRSAEIGYWLGRTHWGRGIATAAVRVLADHGFTHHDLARIYAVVFAHNATSGRVLEKAGFTLEARLRQAVTKDGQTMDGLLYALVR
ncbi:GNAT family N-acetyltransferase [Hymenobacter arizonensis]|uniref:Protein N-acetyltransferase, RimJ/RimL family n=1 Tax=Hymenobacter arizonensis TaxID=1227077 RepID=A0A1I5XIC7_HYMAR|nr:GNAT family protein [Hymenobacter arizonensis]SFQ31417.1 Protein N-acetyltransferase, RimJ/RimL family [Hymenobacter arizonensis]